MRTVGYRSQRTLANAVHVDGVGFITGSRVRIRFLPAAPNTGIRFRRTDLQGCPEFPALADHVTDTDRRTTLGPAHEGITLVEHVMAALGGLRVDNCVVEVNGPEPPGLDGSSRGFVDAILAAKIVVQQARRPIRTPAKTLTIAANGATISIHPGETIGLCASYFLDYGLLAPVPRQNFTTDATPKSFLNDVADCRTFLTEAEAITLRSMGIGKHVTSADVLVFGPHGVKENRLRYADEPARHKVLDMIGDLALCGFDLAGHVVAYRSGHALNVELARRLLRAASSTTAAGPTARPQLVRRAA